MKKLNLIGQKYHRLTVLEEADKISGRTAWKCQCECGNIKIVKTDNLRDGSTKSCGCWNKEQNFKKVKKMYTTRTKYTPVEASARRVWRGRYSEMPFEDFYELSQQNCFYCNEAPSNVQNDADKRYSMERQTQGFFTYNGLDRLDNTLPHSKQNCVPCCKYCNYAKRERGLEEFKNWIIRAYNYSINK